MHLVLLTGVAIALASPVLASDAVIGTETTFQSPNGLAERCVQIAPIPGGQYSDGDVKDEAAFCQIDLYAPDIALCPKTWSTSPGMMIYDVSAGNYAMDRTGFERNACAEGKSAKSLANGDLAKFKECWVSINLDLRSFVVIFVFICCMKSASN